MRMSLNCLLLGENSDKSFLVDIGKEIIVINGRKNTKIRDIKISHIKYLVFCQMNDENIKPDALKFPDISSCDYPLAQINGGQEIISGVGYVSKSEINDDSAIFVDCGITSLKSDDENKKFWMVKEPLAI
ncbi:hypothetical protein RhiirB3_472116 [Rhizophagus irregularis]|nr:hypothetical protein RhiirB3_472116 [Rhizophagus irregularis]